MKAQDTWDLDVPSHPSPYTGIIKNFYAHIAAFLSFPTVMLTKLDLEINAGAIVRQIQIAIGETSVGSVGQIIFEPGLAVNAGESLKVKCIQPGNEKIISCSGGVDVYPAATENLYYETQVNYAFKAGDTLRMEGRINGDVASKSRLYLELDVKHETDLHTTTGSYEVLGTTVEITEDCSSVIVGMVVYSDGQGTYHLDDVRLYLTRGDVGDDMINPVRSIEYFERDYEGIDESFYVDCGLSYEGDPATEITGLGHLVGWDVTILADGQVVPNQVVEGVYAPSGELLDGKITLETAASVVHIGIPFTSLMETLRLDQGASEGSARGKMQRIHEVAVEFLNSAGVKVGRDEDNLEQIITRRSGAGGDLFGEPTALFTGIKSIKYPGGSDVDVRVVLVQDQPLPVKVLAIVPRLRTQDK